MSTWDSFLLENNELLSRIRHTLKEETDIGISITPPEEKQLRFLSCNLSAVKVLILGQDPYPQTGIATGRAFEVGKLHSWFDTFRNTSLRNIVRAIYAAQHGEILKYNEILAKIKDNSFQILPPDKLFDSLEEQGVLFLNTAFSCSIGMPGSHIALWEPFTARLLSFIASQNPQILWFIWGNFAEKQTRMLPIQKIISSHPMICCNRPGDFLFDVNMFEKTKHMICWTGIRNAV